MLQQQEQNTAKFLIVSKIPYAIVGSPVQIKGEAYLVSFCHSLGVSMCSSSEYGISIK